MIYKFNDEFTLEEREVPHFGKLSYIIKKNYQDLIVLSENQSLIIQQAMLKSSVSLQKYSLNDYQYLITENILLPNDKNKCISDKLSSSTLSFWLHVTDICNLACNYCYIPSLNRKTKIKNDLLMKLSEKLFEVNGLTTVRLKIAGGEPFCAFNDWSNQLVSFIEILEAKRITPIIQVITNLTILSNKHLEFIKKHNIHIALSLDGLATEHNKVRFFKNTGLGCFDKIMKNLEKLKVLGIKPIVLITVSSENKQGILPLVIFLIKQGFVFRLADAKGEFIHVDEFTEQLKLVIKSFYHQNIPIANKIVISDLNLDAPSATACNKGINSADIYSDGKIYFCHSQFGRDKPIGDLYDNENILTTIRKSKVKHFNLHDNCFNCSFRFICAGGCPLYRVKGKSPMCASYKEIITGMLEFYNYEKTKYNDYRNSRK